MLLPLFHSAFVCSSSKFIVRKLCYTHNSRNGYVVLSAAYSPSYSSHQECSSYRAYSDDIFSLVPVTDCIYSSFPRLAENCSHLFLRVLANPHWAEVYYTFTSSVGLFRSEFLLSLG